MATARPSHVREPSVTTLDCDVNPNFTFPAAQPDERPLSLQFPQSNFPGNDNYAFPPRRGSVPLLGATPQVATRPRSDSGDAMKHLQRTVASSETPLPSPGSPFNLNTNPWANPSTPYYAPGQTRTRVVGEGVAPTVLNASVRLGPVPTKANLHNRNASELLKVPMLEPGTEDSKPSLSPPKKVVPPPPSGVRPRRGHAHRRSGAISSSDVWSLMNQSAPALPLPPAPAAEIKPPVPEVADPDKSRLSPGHSPRLSRSAPVSPGIAPGKMSLGGRYFGLLIKI